MPTYDLPLEIEIPVSHSGCAYYSGEDEIELTAKQVKTLFKIMQEACENDQTLSTLDLRHTNLEEVDPELYRLFYETYYDFAYDTTFRHCVYDAYYFNGCVDWDEVRDICIDEYDYDAPDDDLDEDASYNKHFQEWFEKNISNVGKIGDFERRAHLLRGLDMDGFEFDSPILLPPDLVDEFFNS